MSREIPDEMDVGGKNKEQIKCTFFFAWATGKLKLSLTEVEKAHLTDKYIQRLRSAQIFVKP